MMSFNSLVKTLINKPAPMLGGKTDIVPVLRNCCEYVLANRVREQNSRKLQEHLETLRQFGARLLKQPQQGLNNTV